MATVTSLIVLALLPLEGWSADIDVRDNLLVKAGENLKVDCAEVKNGNKRIYLLLEETDITVTICIKRPGDLSCSGTFSARYKGRISHPSDTSYLIHAVQGNESGNYVCELSEEDITPRKVYSNVIVVEAPSRQPNVGDTYVIEYESGEFRCMLKNDPKATTYHWRKKGTSGHVESKENDPTLQVTRVQRNQNGEEYQCNASNIAGSSSWSNWATLYVLYPPPDRPAILNHDEGSTKNVFSNDTLSLTCEINGGNPLANLTWNCASLTGQQRQEGNRSMSDLIGTITSAMNGQTCTCTASHFVWTDANRPTGYGIRLNVYYPPSKPTLNPVPSLPWMENKQYIVDCVVLSSGNDACSYRWFKGGALIEGKTERKLRLLVNKDDNDMEIKCEVNNKYTERTPGDYTARIHLIVQYAPDLGASIDTHQNNSVVHKYANDNINLTCRVAGGRPLANLTWSCPAGLTATQNQDTEGRVTRSVLTGKLNKSMNSATCSCVAVWWGTQHLWAALVNLNIFYPPDQPTLRADPRMPWLENGSYTMACVVADRGNSMCNYRWYRDNKEVLGETSNRLPLTVTKEDNSSDVRCTLDNEYIQTKGGSYSSSTKLNVEYTPVIQPINPVTSPENSTVTLTCQAMGNPSPVNSDYRWSFEGELKPSGKILRLEKISKTDAGEYICTVAVQSNGDHGQLSSNRSTTVTVQYLHIKDHPAPQEVTEGQPFTLTCTAEGIPQASHFSRWSHVGPYVGSRWVGQSVNSSSSSYSVTKAHYNESGTYTCHVANQVDNKQAATTVTVNFPPKNETHPVDKKVVYVELFHTASLEITVFAHPEVVNFTWLQVKKALGNFSKIGNEEGKFSIISNRLFSRLEILNVTLEECTSYTLNADNTILNGSKFHFQLKAKGCPERPDIDHVSVTAASITATWRPNFNGGYKQTLSVSLCNGTSCYQVDIHVEPEYNLPVLTHIQDLEGSTCYDLFVEAHNDHEEKGDGKGCSVQTRRQDVCTKEQPTIRKGAFTVVYSGENAQLTWERPNVDNYDRQVLEQWQVVTRRRRQLVTCMESALCNQTEVPLSQLSFFVGVLPGRTYQFRLVLYDGQVPVSSFTAEVKNGTCIQEICRCNNGAGPIVGAFIGGLVAGALILLMVDAYVIHQKELLPYLTSSKSKGERYQMKVREVHTDIPLTYEDTTCCPGTNEDSSAYCDLKKNEGDHMYSDLCGDSATRQNSSQKASTVRKQCDKEDKIKSGQETKEYCELSFQNKDHPYMDLKLKSK